MSGINATLSSRDAKLAMKAARMSTVDSAGTKETGAEQLQVSQWSSVVAGVVLIAVLAAILYGLDVHLDLDVPVIEELPKRLLYAARMHVFGTVPLVAAILCSLFSECAHDVLHQSSVQLLLLMFIHVILLSFEASYSKLMMLCLSIWTIGRFLSLGCSFSARGRSVASVVSLFPILVAVTLTLNCLWQQGMLSGLEQLDPKEEEEEETKGFFF